jgi:aminopeptidase N
MHRFLVDNAHRPVTTADYAIAMEKTCGCDLDWFFDQWAYGIGYPTVRFTRQWNAAANLLQLTVEQTQAIDSTHPLFRFPVTIRVITRDSVVRHEILVSKPTETFALPLPSGPLSFRFDEGGWLLGTVRGDQTPAELARLAKHDLDIRGRRWALEQLAGNHDSVALDARRFVVLNEHSGWLRSTALREMAADSNPASVTVVRAALRDPDSEVRAAALRTLRGLDSAAAVAAASTMYPSDPNNTVRQAALDVLAQAQGVAALPLLVEAVAAGQPFSLRLTAAHHLSRLGGAEAEGALEQLTVPDEDRNIRITGLSALATTGDSARARTVALRAVADPDPLFAAAAVRTVARVGGEAGAAALREALKRETRVTVRLAITRALERH